MYVCMYACMYVCVQKYVCTCIFYFFIGLKRTWSLRVHESLASSSKHPQSSGAVTGFLRDSGLIIMLILIALIVGINAQSLLPCIITQSLLP